VRAELELPEVGERAELDQLGMELFDQREKVVDRVDVRVAQDVMDAQARQRVAAHRLEKFDVADDLLEARAAADVLEELLRPAVDRDRETADSARRSASRSRAASAASHS
jgi:hypothetical protein